MFIVASAKQSMEARPRVFSFGRTTIFFKDLEPDRAPRLQFALAAATPKPATSTSSLLHHIRAVPQSVILIDGNNLRGSECFSISYEQIVHRTVCFAAAYQLILLLVLDHGVHEQAWRIGQRSAVALSGEAQTADDVIVRDSFWLQRLHSRNVFVVSSDGGLTRRVRKSRRQR